MTGLKTSRLIDTTPCREVRTRTQEVGGCPYPSMGNEIVKNMKFWEHCRELEDKLDEVESRGFHLSQSQYFGKPYREYEKIPLTKRWMTEFYRRHGDDKPEDWKKRYDDYISDLKARGWRLVDGSFCNPEMGDC